VNGDKTKPVSVNAIDGGDIEADRSGRCWYDVDNAAVGKSNAFGESHFDEAGAIGDPGVGDAGVQHADWFDRNELRRGRRTCGTCRVKFSNSDRCRTARSERDPTETPPGRRK